MSIDKLDDDYIISSLNLTNKSNITKNPMYLFSRIKNKKFNYLNTATSSTRNNTLENSYFKISSFSYKNQNNLLSNFTSLNSKLSSAIKKLYKKYKKVKVKEKVKNLKFNTNSSKPKFLPDIKEKKQIIDYQTLLLKGKMFGKLNKNKVINQAQLNIYKETNDDFNDAFRQHEYLKNLKLYK